MGILTDLFYSNLPMSDVGLKNLFNNEDLFTAVPADWHIVITDIKNSTQAISEGQHHTINYLATGSIVTVLNITQKMGIEVPFFFGGDGATFIIPPGIIEHVMRALSLFKNNCRSTYGLELRTNTVAVQRIYNDFYHLRICKHVRSSSFSMPVILGNGLSYAEKLIKANDYPRLTYLPQKTALDLSGMQCRWDRIAPPENFDEVVALIVMVRDDCQQTQILSGLLQKLDTTYGLSTTRQPITATRLRQRNTFANQSKQLKSRFSKFPILKFVQSQMASVYDFFYLRTLKGKLFLKQLVEMSDTVVLDGKISTIISGTLNQRRDLEEYLDQLELDKKIFYGIHVSSDSIMSCYVRNMENEHIHFVDGSEGGYTQAATVLKLKINQSKKER